MDKGKISVWERQNKNKQDFVCNGKIRDLIATEGCTIPEEFEWIVVADGHGNSTVLNIIREANWAQIVSSPNIKDEIYKMFPDFGGKSTKGSGATLSIVKIYQNHFKNYWIGDSTINIYRNKDLIFKSRSHDVDNDNELLRVASISSKSMVWRPKILSTAVNDEQRNECAKIPRIYDAKGILTMEKTGAYFRFSNGDSISMTHSLGHDNVTGKFLESDIVVRDPNVDYRVIVGSDGLWDMIVDEDIDIMLQINSAEEIGDIVKNRWYQPWLFVQLGSTLIEGSVTEFPDDNIDDICVAVWIG